jgi:hypothetical protein|tara:strand:+ start:680 stop:1063 length:384 start_codon:yes stop_codon:yes gene_type:complete
MPALNTETRLVMTILFVGTVSGANVFFYANYGTGFPHGTLAHAILFGLITVGAIMVLKALFDIALNDRIEMYLLDQRIKAYWERKSKEEAQKNKIRETYKTSIVAQQQPTYETAENSIGNEFLAALQ